MAIKASFSDTNLAPNANFFSALMRLSESTDKPKISAKWFVIRVTPDLATGEKLNIGVGIIVNNEVFTKLLPNSSPFEVLYGKNGLDNFSFLLNLVKNTMSENTLNRSISPQITFSSPQFVAGNNVDEILNRLYSSMITLHSATKESKQIRKNLGTEEVRKRVFSQLQKVDIEWVERIWHDEDKPIVVPPSLGESITLNHLQIWSDPSIIDDRVRFGSIISTDYVSEMHSKFHLMQASQDIQRAAASIRNEKSQAGLFIYRPEDLEKSISAEIDNKIDTTHWLLTKQLGKSLTVEVESDVAKIVTQIQKLAA